MLSNPWWESDPRERFWLEVTDRTDLGHNLWSPKTSGSGRTTSGYESMRHVRPGDVIFHYWQQAGTKPAIVGASIATGVAFRSTITWLARGKNTKGQSARRVPAWEVPIDSYAEVSQAIDLDAFRQKEGALRRIYDHMVSLHGEPIYFPFRFSSKQALRANQVYLTKFPADIVDLYPSLSEFSALRDSPPTPGGAGIQRDESDPGAKMLGPRWQQDPKARRAVELQAVKQAKEHFEAADLRVVVKGKPYDLLLTNEENDDIVHVEVKGSSDAVTSVELTKNEVKDANAPEWESVLVVVDQIPIDFTSKGVEPDLPATKPGRLRLWRSWSPEPERLVATKYLYTVPPGGHTKKSKVAR